MKIFLITVALCGAVVLYYLHTYDKISWFKSDAKTEQGDEKKKGKKSSDETEQSSGVSINNRWEMPEKLKEISGLSYIDEGRFACVEDETGTIYIYNTTAKQVEKEIPFSGAGDYEGIAIVNKTAYVVRSDGKIFEVDNIDMKKPAVKEYTTSFTEKHNIEGLCFDKQNNRLLLAVKDNDPSSEEYKGIYSFSLSSKTLAEEPAYKIDLSHPMLAQEKSKKKKSGVSPSAISIHPSSGDLHITDGPASKLLVMDQQGKIKSYINLGSDSFPQPEGITFDSKGTAYISNEGKKGNGSIVEVSFSK